MRWVTVPAGPVIVIDASRGFHFRVLLTENCVIEPPKNATSGQRIILRIEQPASAVSVSLHANWTSRGSVTMPSSGVGYLDALYDDVAKVWEARGTPDLSSVYDAAGTAASAISTHEAAGNPHPGYLTQAEGDGLYEPIITADTGWSVSNFATTKTIDATTPDLEITTDTLCTLITILKVKGILDG